MPVNRRLFLACCGIAIATTARSALICSAQTSISLDGKVSHAMALNTVIDNSQKLSADRREVLEEAVAKIRRASQDGPINILGVCTHNSRRSQFCEAWCALAVAHYEVPGVTCFSCGTEATACNPRTIDALERNGWKIKRPESVSGNPQYECTFANVKTVRLWSKAFGDPSLPSARIVALMCCDEADKACPMVPGALARVALHYVDPKVSDGTAQEAATYDKRCQQIAAEMFYLIRQLSSSTAAH